MRIKIIFLSNVVKIFQCKWNTLERYFTIDTEVIYTCTMIIVQTIGKLHCIVGTTSKTEKLSNVSWFFLNYIDIISMYLWETPLYIFFKLHWKEIIKNIILPILQDLSNVLSNVLHHNRSVILNHFCINSKVPFQCISPTLENFYYIGKFLKILFTYWYSIYLASFSL